MTSTRRTEETQMTSATRRRHVARTMVLALLAPLALAIGLAAAAATPAQAAASWQWSWDHQRGCWNGATYDGNQNGRPETIWIDVNGDCRLDSVAFDINGRDDLLEQLWSDVDGNGRWDVVFIDTDQRVGFEYFYADTNQDGYWDRYGWLAQVRTPSTADIYVGPTSIGAPTNPSGFYSLMVTMSRITGRAVG